MLALVRDGISADDCSLGVLDVPSMAGSASMPLRSQWANFRQLIKHCLVHFPAMLPADVLLRSEALQIVGMVVPGVLINVVDVAPFRNRPILGFPHIPVQVPRMAFEIKAVSAARRVRVPTVHPATELNSF